MFHLVLATDRRHTLLPTLPELRAGVRLLDRVAGERLLLFSLVDDHVHLVVRGSRRDTGYLGSALRRAFARLAPDRPLDPAHVRSIDGRSHLDWLVTTYLPAQPAKHGLAPRPALYEGSAFQDLVGARALGTYQPGALLEELPRLRLSSLWPAVQLVGGPLEPATTEQVRAAGAHRLAAAARSAFATDALGRGAAALQARRAAATVAVTAGLRLTELARALGTPHRSVVRAAHGPAETEPLLRRLALELRA